MNLRLRPVLCRALLTFEVLLLTFGAPLALYYGAQNRWVMVGALWGMALLFWLYSWRQHRARVLWHGHTPEKKWQRMMLWRWAIAMLAVAVITVALVPERLFAFPLERPQTWLTVMLLYPVLSVLPQEIIYRTFYFTRYESIVQSRGVLIALSAVGYGLTHVMMENLVAPLLSIIGGLIFAGSYARHKSLKWAVIEHSLYGCGVFTLGLGWYFYFGAWR